MINKSLLPIAKFGLLKVLYSLLALVVFLIIDCDILSFLAFVVLTSLIYVYRNPEREVQIFEKNSVVSTVDGTVTSIEELENSEYTYVITIESDLSDVGVLRAPMNSKVLEMQVNYGTKVSSRSKLFDLLNENASLTFEDDLSNKLKVEHRMKQNFDSISIDALEDQFFAQSSRYGFIANGTTKIYLPSNFRFNITVGNEVSASQSLIGYFS